MKNQEKQEFQKLVFDEAKFPHLTNVKDSVEQLSSYIEKLNKRKLLINNQQEMKSEFQKNEDEILLIITDRDLAKSHKNLAEKNDYVKNFSEKLVTYIEEVNENYESMVQKAHNYYENNKKSKTNEIVKALEVEWENVKNTDLNQNWEVRIKHYIVLRTIFETGNKKK